MPNKAWMGAAAVYFTAGLGVANAADLKTAPMSNQGSRHQQRAIELKSALPFDIDGYRIGTLAKKNDYPGVESGIDNPDIPDLKPDIRRYYITCASNYTGDVEIYRKWHKGPRQKLIRFLRDSDNMSVIYFIADNNKQYIYGITSDSRALTNGVPMLIESKYWDCTLYDNAKRKSENKDAE